MHVSYSLYGQPNGKRVKRFITDLLSLGIQGFSAFYQNRKQNKLKKGIKKLFERQNRLDNRVTRCDNDMISLARTTLKSLDHFQKELVRQGEHIKHLTNRVKHVEIESILCIVVNAPIIVVAL